MLNIKRLSSNRADRTKLYYAWTPNMGPGINIKQLADDIRTAGPGTAAANQFDNMVSQSLNQSGIPTPPAKVKNVRNRAGQILQDNKPQSIRGNSTSTKQQPPQNRAQRRSNGRGRGRGGSAEPPGPAPGLPNRPSSDQNSAFRNLISGGMIGFASKIDGSPYAVPFAQQQVDSNSNTCRTWIHLIDIGKDALFDCADNTVLDDALSQIFADYKTEVVINTNGGTTVTRAEFTRDKLYDYIRTASSGVAMSQEIRSLRVWDPIVPESNQVIRKFKDAVGVSTQLMTSLNRMESRLALMVLPPKLVEFYGWNFQTFKKSPVEGGVHQRLVSKALFKDLASQDVEHEFQFVCSAMDAISDHIDDELTTIAAITALFEQKAGLTTINLRNQPNQSPTPVYDANWNAIWNNGYQVYPNLEDNDAARAKGLIIPGASLKVAVPHDVNNIEIHVSSSWLINYNAFPSVATPEKSGYPFFKLCTNSLYDSLNYCNQFYVEDNSSQPWKYSIRRINSAEKQISDYNYTIGIYADQGTYVPSGLNTTLYEPTFVSTTEACKLLLLDMFECSV